MSSFEKKKEGETEAEESEEKETKLPPGDDLKLGLQEAFSEYKISLQTECERLLVKEEQWSPRTWQRGPVHLIRSKDQIESPTDEVQCELSWRDFEFYGIAKYYSLLEYNDIFRHLKDRQQRTVRSVLTVGEAGAGKTFSVLKFCQDWARGSENRDLDLVIPLLPLSFAELVRKKRCSLLGLIHIKYPALQSLSPHSLRQTNALFICNDLFLDLDFSCEVISDVTQMSEVHVLLVNLIRGDLLPKARIWILSRPESAKQIPMSYIDRFTEVRWFFTDEKKKDFFMTRFSNIQQLQRALSLLRASHNLWIMCDNPFFASIIATVLAHIFRNTQSDVQPFTITEIFAHFLMIQTSRAPESKSGLVDLFHRLYVSERESNTAESAPLKLGRLAFDHLLTGNTVFSTEELKKVDLDLSEAPSELCTKVFPQENVLEQSFFFDLSLLQFMAAVYLHHCFSHNPDVVKEFVHVGVDDNQKDVEKDDERTTSNLSLIEFLRQTLNKSLQSPNGQLNLFVRFLHGLCLESNQKLIGSMLSPIDQSEIPQVIKNLKESHLKEASPDKSIDIFLCLMELDQTVQLQTRDFLWSEVESKNFLSEIQCSALAYILQTSGRVEHQLDLNEYNTTQEGRKKLIPAVRNSRRALLTDCGLTETDCAVVASALSSYPSQLDELDLSGNSFKNTELEVLSKALQSPHCNLSVLSLNNCALTEDSWVLLASSLKSNLKVLNLSKNPDLKDPEWCFTSFLQSSRCRLKTLRLSECGLSDSTCASLASALTSGSSLRVLDLSLNPGIKDSGVKHLKTLLENQKCHLNTLSLLRCGLSDLSCQYLVSALETHPSLPLDELDLRQNNFSFVGIRELSFFLRRPGHSLSTIRIPLLNEYSLLQDRTGYKERWGQTKQHTSLSVCSVDPTPSTSDPPGPQPGLQDCEGETLFSPKRSKYSGYPYITYRFICPSSGTFHCASTGLVFVVTEKVALSYKTVQWDESQLQSSGRTPAGPLYDIECAERAVRELHLPHCDTETVTSAACSLSVAHVTDSGVSFLQPLRVTQTHVVIPVSALSAYGLVWQFLDWIRHMIKSVLGQVLLFIAPQNPFTHQRKLNVLLLPVNVSVDEVCPKYPNMKNVQVPALCNLTASQNYSVDCLGAHKVQPKKALFILDYGPNYHPTFEIRLTATMKLIYIKIYDINSTSVWEHEVDLTDLITEEQSRESSRERSLALSPHSFRSLLAGSTENVRQTLSSIRCEFIDRVSEAVLDQVLDRLLQSKVLHPAERECAASKERRHRAALLLDTVLKKGSKASRLFILDLNDLDPLLLEELLNPVQL